MPRDYQLILGNACNLKCRTCNANYSSKWRKESIDRNIEFWEPPSKIDLHDLEQSKFWLDIEDWLPHVRVLEIMGGEPFYMKEFRKLIDKLVDMGVSKNIMITLSTNGTHYNDKLIDKIVGNFENLGFNGSVVGCLFGFYFPLMFTFSVLRKGLNLFKNGFRFVKTFQHKINVRLGDGDR